MILLAAAEVFERRGYAAAGVAEIASRARCTTGALYFHYASKDGLAAAVVQAHFEAWSPMVEAVESLPAPALEQLLALSYLVIRAFRDNVLVRAGARLWTERLAIDATLPPPFTGWIAVVTGLLARARSQGDLPATAACSEIADVLVCALFGVHTVSDALDARARIEDHLGALWTLLLPGLTGRSVDSAPLLLRARRSADDLGSAR